VARQLSAMSMVTITVPDPLDATLAERVKSARARSNEECLLSLVESGAARRVNWGACWQSGRSDLLLRSSRTGKSGYVEQVIDDDIVALR
jgi:hypothetical protein